MTKLCKDCRWIRPRDDAQPLCGHPTSASPASVSLVTGETIAPRQYLCEDVRHFDAFNAYCGREGLHWEAADATPAGFT
jgi:hypothetical protein